MSTGGEGIADCAGILARHKNTKRENKTLLTTADSGGARGEFKL
jgi:hypothetical protein